MGTNQPILSENRTLAQDVLDVLSNLSPHLKEAEALMEAVSEGLDDSTLAELAELLNAAAATVDEAGRRSAIVSAYGTLKAKREEESARRAKEAEQANDRIDIDFP